MLKYCLLITLLITSLLLAFLFSNVELLPILIAAIIVFFGFIFLMQFLKKDEEYFKNSILAAGVGVTIISWFITGYLNHKNEKKGALLEFERSTNQSKRDLKVKFLIDAYFRLENSDYRDTSPPGHQKNRYDQIYLKYAESALTSIQLLGGDSTVKLANSFIISGGKEHFNDLLKTLRNELRSELNLQPLPTTLDFNPSVYRTYRTLDAPNQLSPEQEFQLVLRLNEFERALLK